MRHEVREPDHFILFCDSANVWCAAPPRFRDLVLDPTGWGLTREEAIAGLINHPEFQERTVLGEWPLPAMTDFVVVHVREPGSSNEEAALRRQTFRVV